MCVPNKVSSPLWKLEYVFHSDLACCIMNKCKSPTREVGVDESEHMFRNMFQKVQFSVGIVIFTTPATFISFCIEQ